MDRQSFLELIGEIALPVGDAEPGFGTPESQQEQTILSQLAAQVIDDPLLLEMFSQRVYQLMQEDWRNQQERSRNYRGWF